MSACGGKQGSWCIGAKEPRAVGVWSTDSGRFSREMSCEEPKRRLARFFLVLGRVLWRVREHKCITVSMSCIKFEF